jgi:quercetin dioxygenase-like cupin family protein
MSIYTVKEEDVRVHKTDGGVMTTLMSPSLGGSGSTSMWKVTMAGGQSGPPHVISSEQIWHVITGRASIEAAGEVAEVEAGDTVAIPGGVMRQVIAREDTVFGVYGLANAKASAHPGEADAIIPPWIV